MYSVIEFKQEEDGGGLSIVNSTWLTPRKTEVRWPPIKDNLQFKKVLRKLEPEIDETWKIYGVQKIFYSTDDFEKATNKLKRAEITSDLQTDLEDDNTRPRRKILKRKFSSDEDSNDQVSLFKPGKKSKQILPWPPPVGINKLYTNPRGSSQELESGTDESDPGIPSGSQFMKSISTPRDKLSFQISTPKSSSSFGRQEATEIQTPTLNESLNFDNSLQDTNGLKVLLKHILTIKEQNRKILNILEKSKPFENSDLPDDFKIKLPIESLQDLEELEIYLTEEENFNTFKSYCASISNLKDVTQKNNRILRSLLTDNIAKHFNYFGNNRRQDRVSNKRPFNQLRLNKVVLDAVKQGTDFTTHEVENAIKRWLKHAPNRNKKNY
ncbi:uncharacterized protein LOC126887142 [Diabrotica virgifera virgifera]|uniref:DUF4806 domain-containing protein n=1 Tax=Diabrotica virgifera virgifera TaxID=50390 RepID=A0ABM5KJS6_DIAVI|nr:uncharacterized protein LOC126887142 [Diabrotica virgifera virgifera]